jgi:hypothetical protein
MWHRFMKKKSEVENPVLLSFQGKNHTDIDFYKDIVCNELLILILPERNCLKGYNHSD